MRHHFGDLLNRDGGYWTIIPNRERYAYEIGDVPEGSPTITIVTIGDQDAHWRRVLTLPNLEELTLHKPTKEQLVAVADLKRVKRLRITHARPRDIRFIESMQGVEELVLEYVSGFSDLAPLRSLKRLRALHIENLRRVTSFQGLAGIASLRLLSINGTVDWKQPVADFEFLRGLSGLEVLQMWEVINKTPYPALLPALSLSKLKKLKVHGSYLAAEEYALLEAGLSGVDGAVWAPFSEIAYSYMPVPADDLRSRIPEDVIRANHPEVVLHFDGTRKIADPATTWYEFVGKGAGRVKCTSANAEARCQAYAARYSAMKAQAAKLISEQDSTSPRQA